ncbi:MAG: response regulator [Thermoproteota archaeon]|nr:response regulator [Thermoproteota archaeon]
MNEKRTILLIDNDQRSSYIISLILKLNGYDVDYYADPKPVLSKLRSRMYDLILLNLTSIETNYIELYNDIRKKDAQVKICFMTDNRFQNETRHDEKFVQPSKRDHLTSCDFVDKPVNANEILEIIVSHLERQY